MTENQVVVPYQQLNPEVLRALIEEFIAREGTVYGAEDPALDDQVNRITNQLKSGDTVIVWDLAANSGSFLKKRDL